jgi:hypothetical protein
MKQVLGVLEKFERDNQNMRDSENSWNGDGNNLEI